MPKLIHFILVKIGSPFSFGVDFLQFVLELLALIFEIPHLLSNFFLFLLFRNNLFNFLFNFFDFFNFISLFFLFFNFLRFFLFFLLYFLIDFYYLRRFLLRLNLRYLFILHRFLKLNDIRKIVFQGVLLLAIF